MSNRVLRQKPRISYYEPEEPPLDEHIFCESCGDFVYEYCSIHGPLLVVPDDKVNRNGIPAIVPRAALTIPKVFLHLAPSIIPGAGLGVFATLTLPRGVRFGPYRGKRTPVADSMYCWQIYDKNHKPSHVVDAVDSNSSNWMRYVNCARHWREQNLVAFQYRGELYYRTIKIIPRFTELMVFYGGIFARELQVDLATYNSPAGYAQKFGAPPIKKRKTIEIKPQHPARETSKETVSNKDTPDDINSSLNHPSEPENKNTKIKPIFGKSKDRKKETAKLNKIVKTNSIQNKKTVKNAIENIRNLKKLPLKTDIVTEKKDITKIETIPLVQQVPKNSHKVIDLYKYCEVCNFKCILKDELAKHMRFHDNNRPHVCDVCDYRFGLLSSLNSHKAALHNIDNLKEYFCDICDFKSIQKGYLIEHMRRHTGEKPFSCDICKYKSALKGHLTRHMRRHTGEKPFSCDICNYKSARKGVLTIHMRRHTGEKPFSCDICDYKSAYKSHLTIHLRKHSGETFSCDICSYKSAKKGNLTSHIRRHTGEKPFSCDICDYKSAYRNSLTRHLRKHSGETFSCHICNYKSAEKGNLTIHMKRHTGEKPFSCDICDYKSIHKGNLTIHLRKHSGETFSCDICNYKSGHKGNLTTHMRRHIGEKPF